MSYNFPATNLFHFMCSFPSIRLGKMKDQIVLPLLQKANNEKSNIL